METNEIITDEQLIKAWGYANFGSQSKRDVVAETLRKFAQGYSSGSTAKAIVNELGLATGERLTELGYKYLIANEISLAPSPGGLVWVKCSDEMPNKRSACRFFSDNEEIYFGQISSHDGNSGYVEYVGGNGVTFLKTDVYAKSIEWLSTTKEQEGWVSVEERKPEADTTVWLANKDFTHVFIGCRTYLDNEGWFWAELDRTIYVEKGKIIAEIIMDDDYDVHWWHPVPMLPAPPKQ